MKNKSKKRSKKKIDDRLEYTDIAGRKWKQNKICTERVGCTCDECLGYRPGMG